LDKQIVPGADHKKTGVPGGPHQCGTGRSLDDRARDDRRRRDFVERGGHRMVLKQFSPLARLVPRLRAQRAVDCAFEGPARDDLEPAAAADDLAHGELQR
jgi:hypothetical protein